ncbi:MULTISPECIES: hypothetical protein [Salinivibrio]|uniref:AbiTii domain-containing protein n=1 Tax=Salinivibrio TaxID=51366 RepID=UPI0009845CC5|nr:MULTISPECIES: hypothetical protein [Salinivibrio]OOF08452.1 hypothetical protein BZG83_16040 [Salinivibrio sp. PR919]OOF16874.1 hypothetical protein BZG84_09050 [Salinivibrio sp. PR932]OOF28369.1 hypothetical protein BZJ20_16015 [Salinivibrio proteolyticus]
MVDQSRSEHILELAKELLDDIELSRASAESLILKASRLARWVGSEEIRYWLKLEMKGYNSSNEVSLRYMGITGRWVDREKQRGYWGPLAQQEAAIIAEQAKLHAMRVPDTAGDMAFAATKKVTDEMASSTSYISKLSGIKSRVLANLHEFVSEIYYEKQFDSLSESIFERYKSDVDSLIGDSCGDVLEQIPSVMSRLAEGDQEAISQSLTTCRRVIDSFADNIFPPSEETIEIGGNQLSLAANRHQNRINAYIHQRIDSNSRKKRFRQNLANLYDRVSTGVHNEVTVEEARALFLNTYLLIGEILHLPSSDA